MKNKSFYADKANEILELYKERGKGGFESKFSLQDVIWETELLFFGYHQNYPALFDLKEIKENYKEHLRRGDNTAEEVRQHILRFIKFLKEYH